MAHPGAAYPGFHSMKPQGILLFPPGLDASPSQGYTPPPPFISLSFPSNQPPSIHTPRWRVALLG